MANTRQMQLEIRRFESEKIANQKQIASLKLIERKTEEQAEILKCLEQKDYVAEVEEFKNLMQSKNSVTSKTPYHIVVS